MTLEFQSGSKNEKSEKQLSSKERGQLEVSRMETVKESVKGGSADLVMSDDGKGFGVEYSAEEKLGIHMEMSAELLNRLDDALKALEPKMEVLTNGLRQPNLSTDTQQEMLGELSALIKTKEGLTASKQAIKQSHELYVSKMEELQKEAIKKMQRLIQQTEEQLKGVGKFRGMSDFNPEEWQKVLRFKEEKRNA